MQLPEKHFVRGPQNSATLAIANQYIADFEVRCSEDYESCAQIHYDNIASGYRVMIQSVRRWTTPPGS